MFDPTTRFEVSELVSKSYLPPWCIPPEKSSLKRLRVQRSPILDGSKQSPYMNEVEVIGWISPFVSGIIDFESAIRRTVK